jgi:cystine transport system substrate-binding protein
VNRAGSRQPGMALRQATKRVDVVINDALSVYDYLKQKPDMPVKVVAKYDTNMKNGFMFKKIKEPIRCK